MAMLLRSLKARVISRGARNYRAYADLAVAYEERDWRSNGTWNRVQRMPAGPAAVITPWNAPFMLSTWKTAPALAAGCTMVLKPAEWSPLSCSILADLVQEAGFPPGVFNIVQGIGEEIGAALVANPFLRRISFTGSPETGRLIAVSAAKNLVPFTAELGGKGPLIVFEDCDLDAAAKKAAGQYDDSGQVCLAGTRLLVQESIRDAFLEKLQRLHRCARARRPARRRDDDLAADPPAHLERVAGFVDRARAAGNRIVRGGARAGGLHYEPTLIEPNSNHTEVVQKEVFGPVLTLQTFSDEDEAVYPCQLDPVRAERDRLHGLDGPRRPRRPPDPRRHRVGQHVPRARPHGAVRRRRHQRHGSRGRQLRARLLQRAQDPADPRRHGGMTDAELLAAVEAQREWMEDLLVRLTAAPTPLGEEEPGQAVMEAAFADCGLTPRSVWLDAEALKAAPGASPFSWDVSSKRNVVADWEPRGTGGRSLILNGHVDVVPPAAEQLWTSPPYEPRRDGDWLYGRGAGDMKAGLVAMTGAVRALKRAGYAPNAAVQLQSVVEEECTGHGALMCLLDGATADACVIPEPHPDHITVAQVGVLWFHVEIEGIPAHAAYASEGFNAIDASHTVIAALRELEARLQRRAARALRRLRAPHQPQPGRDRRRRLAVDGARGLHVVLPDRDVSRPGSGGRQTRGGGGPGRRSTSPASATTASPARAPSSATRSRW